ncbi:MAG: DNA polymerase III subunit alpha [Patescibacteria group bacterium]
MTFVHLHTHSHYSLLNALPKINELVERVAQDGDSALALTDDGNLYGAIEFYKTCREHNVKPIIGVDFFVAVRSRQDKISGIDSRRYRLVLLAENYQGFRNLMKLVSRSYTEGFYYKPRIDRELIEEYKEGLIAIIPQFSGETSNYLKINDAVRAQEAWQFYHSLFGENCYLEILHHPESEEQTKLREKIIAFSKTHNAPLVATSDSYYLSPDDKAARDVLVDVGNAKSRGTHRDDIDFSLKSSGEMEGLFSDISEAITNSERIANQCELNLNLGNWTFPTYPIENNRDPVDVLRERAMAGFADRGIAIDDIYQSRVDYELEVIKNKGYDVYFLVVSDLMQYAREHEILTNTRGSAAGCLVSYLIGITNIDPIEYKLPFERFLNPERPSPPDIDMDIADDKRDELIAYAREKYGKDHVAQIGTFGTMAARGAVKDTARALGYDYQKGDQISKLIPMGSQGFAMTIDRALEENPDFAKLYKQDADTQEIVDMARKIEGSARHISIHAAGVVIAPSEYNGEQTTITDFTPIQPDPKGSGKLVTQYNMHAVEDAGLLKYDFLGLKNLTIMYEAIKRIRKTRTVDVDLDTLPLDDTTTYKMLADGGTYGVFQLSSEGMTKWLKELKPTNINDINAMVALYRPGPMEFIPDYIKRKRNARLVSYPHPRTEPYLKDSLGLLIYQDDIMQLAVDMAGYSWLEADTFRKAMGKKIPELMAEQEERFKGGCRESGLSESVIKKLWENIETFAAYGFNKGHAAAYGNVAYKTAYLKANFPAEYMAALLTADSGNTDLIARATKECERMGIPVLPPDINESFEGFSVVVGGGKNGEDQIRFGLFTIKNFGENISHTVIEERKANGAYTSLTDFLERVNGRDMNKKSLEALILSGALDSLADRDAMLGSVDLLLEFVKESRSRNVAQESLFGVIEDMGSHEISLPEPTGTHITLKTGMNEELHYTLPLSSKQKLYWEKELLGLYVSGHPLDKYRDKIEQKGRNIKGAIAKGFQQKYTFAGVLSNCRHITTKNNRRMAFATLSDTTAGLDTVFFSDIYKECRDLLQDDATVQITGKLQRRDGEWGLLAEEIKLLD